MSKSADPLSAQELEERLDELLDAVLSIRRSAAGLARGLASLDVPQQGFALHWVEVVAKTNPEMAYQFADCVPRAFALLDFQGVEAWVITAMDVYDKRGMYPAIAALKEIDQFAERRQENERGVEFGEVSAILELFVRGLSGRQLKMAPAKETYTDTENLFLPEALARFGRRESNFRLYKAMAVHQWAQTWFGTYRTPSGESFSLTQAAQHFADPDKAMRLFHLLETVRLEACIGREFPGLMREIEDLRREAAETLCPSAWDPDLERLRHPDATVKDTFAVLPLLYEQDLPPPLCYQGILLPERVEETMRARKEREKNEFRTALAKMLGDREEAESGELEAEQAPGQLRVRRLTETQTPGKTAFELDLNGRPITPTAEVRSLMQSIIQDLGDIPDEYLVAAGDGAYSKAGPQRPEDVWKGTYHEQGAHLYNEWDYRRRHYRKDWCVLREIDVHPAEQSFVEQTLQKYSGLAVNLRKTFEALRGENRLLRRQRHGDDVDVDALVDAYAELRCGREMSDRIFLKSHKVERNIAVLFMVDMSGSTKGWINDAERESLVLLCEALEILGDRYAIYGFSGITRKRCELYRVKRFDEPYSDLVQRRITGIKPQDYTRMGVTIRHMTKLLGEVEARTKLLVTLSDGKPDDYDGYRGDYGIEDTRQALLEAKIEGIHTFCVTIDAEARDYLPRMYGHANYALIDDVRKLPLKISDIYRHLTS